MSIEHVDIDDIQAQFGLPDHPEKDEKFIELYCQVLTDTIPAFAGIVELSSIKPFCNYVPKEESIEKHERIYVDAINKGAPYPLHIYPENNHFIMSDDYNAYHVYKKIGLKTVLCIILGETENKSVVSKKQIYLTNN